MPVKLLTHNGTVFCGAMLIKFAEIWDIQMRFWSAYVLPGNGIVERSHHAIKCIAARSQGSIMEAVYWDNITLKDDITASTAPANSLHMYKACKKNIELAIPHEHRSWNQQSRRCDEGKDPTWLVFYTIQKKNSDRGL